MTLPDILTITRYADFLALRSHWDALYANDPEAQFFLSWAWLSGVLESHPGEWLILAVQNPAGELTGVFPLRLRTVWSQTHQEARTELMSAGRLFWADYSGLLLMPAHEAGVIDLLANHLRRMNWSHLSLKGLRASEARLQRLLAALEDDRLRISFRESRINGDATDNLVAPHIPLPDRFEDWLSGCLSSNTRQKVRRYLRRLEQTEAYQFTESNPATILRDTLALESLWYRQWQAAKGAETSRLARRYGQIIRDGFERGLVQLLLLWHGQKPVGALASFIDQHLQRVHFFVGGRDPDFDEVPVGLVMHAHNIRLAIDRGLREYDFLRGNEPYKYSLGAIDRRLHYPCISTRSGRNLHGGLDPAAVPQALAIAWQSNQPPDESTAMTLLRQTGQVAAPT